MMHFLSALIVARVRLFRASFIVFALGLMLATANACPTGQTDCDMGDMASGIESSEVCILACGVLLPIEVMVAPEFIGTVASLPRPNHSTGIGLLPEPDFVPRAALHVTSDAKSNSSRRNTMKLTFTATALLLAFSGDAFAASDCCGDLMACCAAMLECCF